jgi:ribosome-associated heat shock protein Hsp15
MRLDLFLKVSRLCAGRSQAQRLCEAGLVSINGSPAKSAHSVKPEDEIVMRVRNRLLIVRVNSIPVKRSVSKAEAASLYATIKDEELSDVQGRHSL